MTLSITGRRVLGKIFNHKKYKFLQYITQSLPLATFPVLEILLDIIGKQYVLVIFFVIFLQ
jgi:hypothetical protein